MLREFHLPKEFFWRRLHSLFGIFLVLFLIQHLLTNSQAALWFGNDGIGFIESVNKIHELPYLQAIELFLLGIPFVIHGVWGIFYAREARLNAFHTDGSKPSMNYSRNRAFSWQRWTAWLLLVGIILHVVQMRFIHYPEKIDTQYTVVISNDSGIHSLAKRLDVRLVPTEKKLLALTNNFGTASLLVVRDTFKSPLMVALYALFVLASTFHGFNGLWTASITWGINGTERSQRLFLRWIWSGAFIVSLMGLAACCLTYWNLKN